ncbi:MAG: hypothetical protein V1818_02400 [Candidatus Aenigmatarchaeota archaeon]
MPDRIITPNQFDIDKAEYYLKNSLLNVPVILVYEAGPKNGCVREFKLYLKRLGENLGEPIKGYLTYARGSKNKNEEYVSKVKQILNRAKKYEEEINKKNEEIRRRNQHSGNTLIASR